MHIENPGIDEIDDHIDKATNRIAVALVILGGLLGSAMIGVFAKAGPHALGIHLLALVGFLISGIFGFWLVWGILRHGDSRPSSAALSAADRLSLDPPQRTSGARARPGLASLACRAPSSSPNPSRETREYLGRQLRDDGFDVLGAARR